MLNGFQWSDFCPEDVKTRSVLKAGWKGSFYCSILDNLWRMRRFINASIVSYRPPDGAVSMGMYLGEDRWSTAIIYSLICWLPILLLDSMTSVKNISTWIIYCIILFYIHYVIVTQYIIFKYCSKCILNHSGLLIWRLLPVACLELEFPPH